MSAGSSETLCKTELSLQIAPRLIGVLVAAMTDYGTYRLASKLLGPGAGPTAVSFTSHKL